jgi:hypothetical protein
MSLFLHWWTVSCRHLLVLIDSFLWPWRNFKVLSSTAAQKKKKII